MTSMERLIYRSVVAGLVLTVLAFAWLADTEHTERVKIEQLTGPNAVTTPTSATSVASTWMCMAYIQGEPWTTRPEVFESHEPSRNAHWTEGVDGATCFDAAGRLTDHGPSGGLGVEDGHGHYRRCVGR